MMLKCLIIDSNENTRAYLKALIQDSDKLELVAGCSDIESGRKLLKSEEIDLLFLDATLQELSWFELIGGLKFSPKVVLVSSSNQYGIQVFEHELIDYLHMPFSQDRFEKAIERVKNNLLISGKSKPMNRHLYIKKGSEYFEVDLKSILWIEAYSDYVIIKTPRQSYIVHSTMKGMEKRLPQSEFKRVHRSYIVRWDKIDAIEDVMVVIGRKMIPIGGTYRREFKQYLRSVV